MNAQAQTKDSLWSGIDVFKVVAGTLAAVSAAVIGSFLGVAGTLIGAAVASLVGTIGQEIYAKSLNRGYKRLQTISGFQTPVAAPAAVGTPAVHTPAEEEAPGHIEPVTARKTGRVRWRRIALAAGAVFVLAMGAVTAIEAFAQESMAGIVGADKSGSSSTFTAVTKKQPKATPSPTVTADPDSSTDPSSTTTPAGGESAGPATSVDPTTDATTPAPQSTTGTPATDGPAPEPTDDAPEGDAPEGDAPAADAPAEQQAPAELQAPAENTPAE